MVVVWQFPRKPFMGIWSTVRFPTEGANLGPIGGI